jgi:hypothetical protein
MILSTPPPWHDAFSLHAHLSTHAPSRLHDAIQPRPTIVDAVRTMPLHLRARRTNICAKNSAPGGEWCRTLPSSDPGDLNLGFSPEQPGRGHVSCRNDAFDKVATHRCCYRLTRPTSGSVFTGCRASPNPPLARSSPTKRSVVPPSPIHRPRWARALPYPSPLTPKEAFAAKHCLQ